MNARRDCPIDIAENIPNPPMLLQEPIDEYPFRRPTQLHEGEQPLLLDRDVTEKIVTEGVESASPGREVIRRRRLNLLPSLIQVLVIAT